MAVIVFLLLVGAVAYRATTEAERRRLLERAVRRFRRWQTASRLDDPQIVSFWTLLCERTRFAPVTPVLVGLNILVFVLMHLGHGAAGAPETLIAWGANVGPRTTNGEWWRLATMLFVHGSVLHLLVDLLGLLAVGPLLERLVGPAALAAVYAAAGLSSSAFAIVVSPTAVSVGASGAIFGVYGLMLAFAIGSVFDSSRPKVPSMLVTYLAPAAAVFILYSLHSSAIAVRPELTAFALGCISGLFLTRGIEERPAPAIRTAPVLVGAMVMVVVTVRPLIGMTDMRPEIHKLAAAEQEMTVRYQAAIDQFSSGRLTVRELAAVIDRDIMPELQASRSRVASLAHIPDEQKRLLTTAQTYLQLRDESWRLRSKALPLADVKMLTQAEMSEVAARYALSRIE
jgi:membrane associated rhomboid family serine protease